MAETRARNEPATGRTPAGETGGGAYRPEQTEPAIRARWDEARAFHADPARVSESRPPYSIVIPPPNVTAALHLGHALNNTLQDILIRAHRMMGFETLWMPGTDHAGIATQTVVDRRLKAEGKPALADYKREEAEGKPGRETFIAQVQQWKDEYERTITEQLKAMGCSCDWARQRFTMDEQCAAAVREAFFRLFKDGLIYRGKRLVNWDPVTQTALADDEVENREIDGQFYYLRYPLVERRLPAGQTERRLPAGQTERRLPAGSDTQPVTWGELARRGYPGASSHPPETQAWITVATTRPESYLGDTAVAINPQDPRAKSLRGYHVQLPLVGRIIPIVEDDYVVMPDPDSADAKAQYATGFLKVTPAHDPNDYDIGQRHKLDIINVMAPDATISDHHGWTDLGDAHIFVGLSREEARKKVVAEFKARGLLENQKPYRHTVGHSYRSHAAIEPYLSDQWYVKVTDDRMRGSALRAMAESQRTTDNFKPRSTNPHDGNLTFHPARYAKTFETWHENLRDWCISRQLWWGHRIPVWTIRTAKGDDRSRSHTIDWISDGLSVAARENADFCVITNPDELDTVFVCVRTEAAQARMQALAAEWQQSHPTRSGVRLLIAQIEQDPDVLDTWFSSALWPLSTMGWPDPERFPDSIGLLDAFNPTSVLCTAREIITLWVSRMVMFNRYFTGGTALRAVTDQGGTALRAVTDQGGTALRAVTRLPADLLNAESFEPQRIPGFVARDPFPAGAASPPDLEHKSRDLPHLELKEASYFVTWRATEGVELSREERERVLQSIGYWNGRGCTVFAAVVMPDHAHALVKPDDGHRIGDIIASVKRFTATAINKQRGRSGSLWQAEPFDHIIRDSSYFTQFLHYIIHNPVKRGLCSDVTAWDATIVHQVVCEAMEWKEKEERHGSESRATTDFHPGRLPFRDVFIHAMIQDGEGRKMSKSLGNGVDPRDIIASHGADAMRFTLCHMTTQTQDVRMPVAMVCPHCGEMVEMRPQEQMRKHPVETCRKCKGRFLSQFAIANNLAQPTSDTPAAKNTSPKFDLGRNFCNKVWNSARFALGILEKAEDQRHGSESRATSLIDRWMLSRLAASVADAEAALRDYQFATYAQILYDLHWRDFCDWYLEGIKPTVERDPAQRAVLRTALDTILRLAHPVLPFITEAIFEKLHETSGTGVSPVTATRGTGVPPVTAAGIDMESRDLLCLSSWPRIDGGALRDEDAEQRFERTRALVTAIREVRAQHNVPPRRKVTLHLPPAFARESGVDTDLVITLAGLEAIEPEPPPGQDHGSESRATNPAVAFTFEAVELHLSNLADAVDAGAERARLERQLADLGKSIAALEARLNNPGYANKAPAHLVQQTRDELDQKRREHTAAAEALGRLS